MFLSVYLLFPPLNPWLSVPQVRTLEMWRGVVEGPTDRTWRKTHIEYERESRNLGEIPRGKLNNGQ